MAIDCDGATTKAENTTAPIFVANTITILAKTLADGAGEGSFGRIIQADEIGSAGVTTTGFFFSHFNTANNLEFAVVGNGLQCAWTAPATDGRWHTVSMAFDRGSTTAPVWEVDFLPVVVTTLTASTGNSGHLPPSGFCIANRTSQDRTWDGGLADIQVFGVVLTSNERDAANRRPGHIRRDINLLFPLNTSSETRDFSGNGSTLTFTGVTTRATFPPNFGPGNIMMLGVGC